MKNNRRLILAVVAVFAVLSVTAFAAEPGSSKDPLVTLSYLEDVFFDKIMD